MPPPGRLPGPPLGRSEAHADCAFSQVASSTPEGRPNPPPPGNPAPPGPALPEGRGIPDGKPPGAPDGRVRGPPDGMVIVTPFSFRQSVYAANAVFPPPPSPVPASSEPPQAVAANSSATDTRPSPAIRRGDVFLSFGTVSPV
nr:hypothetical protein GCM10020092_048260 [Actinoplanes digitatis]